MRERQRHRASQAGVAKSVELQLACSWVWMPHHDLQVCRWKRLSCHAGYQELSRCCTGVNLRSSLHAGEKAYYDIKKVWKLEITTWMFLNKLEIITWMSLNKLEIITWMFLNKLEIITWMSLNKLEIVTWMSLNKLEIITWMSLKKLEIITWMSLNKLEIITWMPSKSVQ